MCVGLFGLKQIQMAFVLGLVLVVQYLQAKSTGGYRCHGKERLVQPLILWVRLHITPGVEPY